MTQPSRNLWRHPDFLKLWTAETVSQVGTQVTQLALPVVAILLLKVTPFEVGLLATIEFLPFILLGLPAGVWVDRLRRRPILIAGDLGRAASLVSIPIAYGLGALTIYQLYVVAFVNGCLTVFFDVAYQSYLPSLVGRDQLVEGNSKLEISRSGAQVVGPSIAGLLIGAVTAPFAILVDAASYVASASFVFLIRRSEPPPQRNVGSDGRALESMRSEIADGLRYVLGHPLLRHIAACTATSNLFSNMIFAILLVYAFRELGLTPQIMGGVFSVGSLGFLGGALVANRIAQRIGVGPTIVASAFLFGPTGLLVAVAPKDVAWAFLVVAVFVGGFSQVVYNVNQVSLRQAITPERMQGRMNATMRFIVWGTIPIGNLLGGALGTVIGLHQTIWIGAIGGFLAFLPVLFSSVRSLERIPEPVGESTGEAVGESSGEFVGEAAVSVADAATKPAGGPTSPASPA